MLSLRQKTGRQCWHFLVYAGHIQEIDFFLSIDEVRMLFNPKIAFKGPQYLRVPKMTEKCLKLPLKALNICVVQK